MTNVSDYLAGQILGDHFTGVGSTPHYTLSETKIAPDGSGGTEWSVGRIAVQSAMQLVGRLGDNSSLIQLTASLPAADNGKTFPFYAIFDASTGGNLLGAGVVGQNESLVVFDPSSNELYVEDNPFSLNDQVHLYDAATGLTDGTLYYVLAPTGNRFQVSLTEGGAAVTFTGAGTGVIASRGAITPATGEEVNLPVGALRITF